MSKSSRISKILAMVAGVCASMPQVGAVPAGVRDKNDVKFGVEKNVNREMNRPNVKGNNLGRRPRSKSMGPLARNVKANNKTVSLAQNTKPQEPNVKSTKSEVNVVKSLGSTFWRDENGRLKRGNVVMVSLGGGLLTGILVGGVLLIANKRVKGRWFWEKSKQPFVNEENEEEDYFKIKKEDNIDDDKKEVHIDDGAGEMDNLNVNEVQINEDEKIGDKINEVEKIDKKLIDETNKEGLPGKKGLPSEN